MHLILSVRQKEHFQQLIYKLKRLSLKRGYSKNQIAAELGVSRTCIYQWWIGYSLSAKRRTIERPKAFLSVQQTVMPNKPRPQFVALMAAVALKEPFDRPDWIFEPESKSVAISRFVGSIFIA
jgi:transcriptional regulator with XRE-family HTH domain